MTAQSHTFLGERGDTVINHGERPAEAPTLRYRDVYEAVLVGLNRARGAKDDADSYEDRDEYTDIDPVAVAQNVCVNLEERAGIFPNIDSDAALEERGATISEYEYEDF